VKLLRIIIISLIVLAVGAFIWITAGSDPEDLLLERLTMADQHLSIAVLILCAFILLSTLTGLPIFYINLAMGFIISFTPALFIAWGVNLVAVMLTFFLVRIFFSDYFQGRYGQKKLIQRINKRIGKYGLWTVVFSRGIYIIPTNIINFSFPLSKITPRSYFLGNTIGLLPECLITVLTGYLLKHEVHLLSSPETRYWEALIIGAFILLSALILILLRIRQNRRKKYKRLKAVPYGE
jgi:uncharacterized membrane protein YdjX (TVP38/TMEM64 family)